VRVLDHPSRSVLPKFVASVISKRVGGKTYYYLATSARVDGKPRIVNQKYLGTAADIEAAMDGAVSCRRGPGIWRSGIWPRPGR
jgi:hypothetical protein